MEILKYEEFQEQISEGSGDFTEFNYKKPSLFQKMKRGIKDIAQIENKEDREMLEKIEEIIMNPPYPDWLTNIRTIGSNAITALVGHKTVLIDCDTSDPVIMINGKKLDINDIQGECDSIFRILKSKI